MIIFVTYNWIIQELDLIKYNDIKIKKYCNSSLQINNQSLFEIKFEREWEAKRVLRDTRLSL